MEMQEGGFVARGSHEVAQCYLNGGFFSCARVQPHKHVLLHAPSSSLHRPSACQPLQAQGDSIHELRCSQTLSPPEARIACHIRFPYSKSSRDRSLCSTALCAGMCSHYTSYPCSPAVVKR